MNYRPIHSYLPNYRLPLCYPDGDYMDPNFESNKGRQHGRVCFMLNHCYLIEGRTKPLTDEECNVIQEFLDFSPAELNTTAGLSNHNNTLQKIIDNSHRIPAHQKENLLLPVNTEASTTPLEAYHDSTLYEPSQQEYIDASNQARAESIVDSETLIHSRKRRHRPPPEAISVGLPFEGTGLKLKLYNRNHKYLQVHR